MDDQKLVFKPIAEMLVNASIGRSVQKVRLRRGLSENALADRLEVDVALLRVWEHGQTRIPPAGLLAIAKSLNCGLQELFSDVAIAVHSGSVVL